MAAVTAWVKPAHRIKGQDHLAVRAPCENLYTQLLPGITNVTDRARLYSFYTWLIWAFEKHAGPLRKQPFANTLRRSEVLLTLVGARHTSASEGELWRHGGGLAGRDTLLPALDLLEDGRTIKLSTYATTEESDYRYFKHKLGGFGQYYSGTMRDLRIIDSGAEVKYSRQRGGVLAEAFDSGVTRERFFEALEKDLVGVENIDELECFCPCFLRSNAREHAALTDLFFNRTEVYYEEFSENRPKTLALMLDLVAQLEEVDHEAAPFGFDAGVFRACVYAGTLPGGAVWRTTDTLEDVRRGWQLYQRNELLSIAVQGLFYSGLAELFKQGLLLRDGEEYGAWLAETFLAGQLSGGQQETFSGAVERARRTIPNIGEWTQPRHEVQLGWMLGDVRNNFDMATRHQDVMQASLDVLVALAARGDATAHSYEGYIESPRYLLHYPINLDSFYRHVRETWQGLTTVDLVRWLGRRWGVETHFLVALRKLRHEARDTFKIRPGERGLEVVEAPVPVFGNPRLNQAKQILWDLGAIDFDGRKDKWVVTGLGKALGEEAARG